jgi:hypothetical protein
MTRPVGIRQPRVLRRSPAWMFALGLLGIALTLPACRKKDKMVSSGGGSSSQSMLTLKGAGR